MRRVPTYPSCPVTRILTATSIPLEDGGDTQPRRNPLAAGFVPLLGGGEADLGRILFLQRRMRYLQGLPACEGTYVSELRPRPGADAPANPSLTENTFSGPPRGRRTLVQDPFDLDANSRITVPSPSVHSTPRRLQRVGATSRIDTSPSRWPRVRPGPAIINIPRGLCSPDLP